MKTARTIKFDDGYTVKLEMHTFEMHTFEMDGGERLTGSVTVSMNGKKGQEFTFIDVIRPVKESDPVAKKIEAAGGNIADFLTNKHGEKPLRAGNGVAEAVTELAAPIKAQNAERDARFAAKRKAEENADAALVEEAKKAIPALVEQIPEGAVRAVVVRTGHFDGEPTYTYTAEGTEVSWRDVTIVGAAHATREGAQSPFWVERIAYITPERLAEIRAEEQAKADAAEAKKAERVAKFAQARETGERVHIGQWTDDCDDPHEECSLDIISEYAMPDGSVSSERTHTY